MYLQWFSTEHRNTTDLMFFKKTGILILIYVCAQNSCRTWKICPVHHQHRQYILLFGTKAWSKNSILVLQRTLGLLWFWVLWRIILNIHAIILSCLRKNHWPNFVSEHPMIFLMFCHQTFVNACSDILYDLWEIQFARSHDFLLNIVCQHSVYIMATVWGCNKGAARDLIWVPSWSVFFL